MIKAMYISIASFTAYNNPSKQFWIDNDKPSIEKIELIILDICKTAIIMDIEIFRSCESSNYQYDKQGKFICSIKGK